MPVYMVKWGDDWQSGHWVFGIFSTKAKAQIAIDIGFSKDDIEFYGVHIATLNIDHIYQSPTI